MANIKFSQFSESTDVANVDFVVGYEGATNVRISPINFINTVGGPFLPLAGGTMTGVTQFNDHTNYGDQVHARFGAGQDLQIYHDGSNSYINDAGTGNLNILGESNIFIGASTGGANMAQFIKGGAVKLRYNDSNKFETTSAGVTVTGGWITSGVSVAQANVEHTDNTKVLFGNANDFEIYHDSTTNQNKITSNLGRQLLVNADSFVVNNLADSANLIIAENSGTVKLYYSGSKKFETTSTGISVTTEIKAVTNGTLFLDNTNNNNPYYLYNSGSNLASLQIGRGTSPGTNVAMAFDNAGQVGIGTTTPLANLDIGNNSGSIYQRWSYDNPGANNYFLSLSETVTAGNVRFCFNQKNAGTNYDNVLVFNQGNVGIGTAEPSEKLEVSGNIKMTSFSNNILFGGTGNSISYNQWLSSAGGGMVIKNVASTSTGHIAFDTSTGEKVRITREGNVGIGTTSPNQKLGVNGNIDIQGGNGSYLTFNNGDANIVINNNGTGRDLSFKTYDGSSSAEKMRITSGGNVGIGTTTPTAKLQVVGLAEHADNAAAITAGLTTGAFYRTGDLLKVVH